MLLKLLLLATTLQYAWAAMCPSFYNDGGDGYCYRAYSVQSARASASQQCNKDGGQLVSVIDNAFGNTKLRNLATANSISSIWLGFVCQNSSYTSCQLDGFNSSLTYVTYRNFAVGSPNLSKGPFVYLDVSSGGWYSGGFANISYICQVRKGDPYPYCDDGYSLKLSKCYGATSAMNQTSGEAKCQKDGGHLASILSNEENIVVFNLTQKGYARIGLILNGNNKLTWTDGTPYNSNEFNGFGELNSDLGNCVSMSQKTETVKAGQWTSSRCDLSLVNICKKDQMHKFNSVSPPQTPRTCSSTTYLHTSGTLSSAGYPTYYGRSDCAYVLSVPSGVVSLAFTEFSLDSQSKMYLYNDVTDTYPFKTLYGSEGLGKTFNSTGPNLKIMFAASGYAGQYNKWMGYFY